MVSDRRVSRPFGLGSSDHGGPSDPHTSFHLDFAHRLRAAGIFKVPRSSAPTPADAETSVSARPPRTMSEQLAIKGTKVDLRQRRDTFCCKKFPTPIAAKKVPHYITHYRALINQLTDLHL
jgi:hypothetical protein